MTPSTRPQANGSFSRTGAGPTGLLNPRGKGWRGGHRKRKLPVVGPPPHASARYSMPRLSQERKRPEHTSLGTQGDTMNHTHTRAAWSHIYINVQITSPCVALRVPCGALVI